MATNYEEEVDAYYAAKVKYTEFLHQAAHELPQEAGSPKKHIPVEERTGCDSWFLQGQKDTAALAQLSKDLADLMKDMKTPKKEPDEPELDPKVKSKGKKK